MDELDPESREHRRLARRHHPDGLLRLPGRALVLGPLHLARLTAKQRALDRPEIKVIALHLDLEDNLVVPVRRRPGRGHGEEARGIEHLQEPVEPNLGEPDLRRREPIQRTVSDSPRLLCERLFGKLIELAHPLVASAATPGRPEKSACVCSILPERKAIRA